MTRLARWAWGTLALNVGVIAWGAFVRATGSGAGCGEHWPLCNGEIVPRAPQIETLIELTHRVTSGLALLAVAGLVYGAFRTTPPQRALRRAGITSFALILSEAAVGAGLVLFRLVADNDSMARALFMGVHLVNTFLLLGALALAAYFASGGRPLRLRGHGSQVGLFGAAAAALMVAGASGAVAALGDTLFPSGSLGEAVAQDLSPTSHLLIRLRILHPVLAAAAGLLTAAVVRYATRARPQAPAPVLARSVEILVVAQIAAGLLNVFLLAPVWLQLGHLVIADALWIAFVLSAASALSEPAALAQPAMHTEAARLV